MFVEEVVSEKDVTKIVIAQLLRSIATLIMYVQNQPVQQKPPRKHQSNNQNKHQSKSQNKLQSKSPTRMYQPRK
jgi:hypothetical protein